MIWATASLILFSLSLSVQAHNGAVAIAVPIEGIAIDGDLSDWPEGMHVYPIREYADTYGKTDLTGTDLDTSTDFSPEFVVGYSLEEQLVYLGVRVRDDQVGGNPGDPHPHHTDACEVHLDAQHGGMPFRYIIVPGGGSFLPGGSNPSLYRQDLGFELPIEKTRSQGAVGRVDDVTVYEWAFDLLGNSLEDNLALTPNMAIGFEVAAVDKDANEDPQAWVAWTSKEPGGGFKDPLLLGDLILVEQDLTLERMLNLLQKSSGDIGNLLQGRTRLITLFTAIPLSFAFLHLVLFLFYPRARANLYFAVFVSSLAYYVSQELGRLGGGDWKFVLMNFSLLGGGLLFFYSLFYPRLPR